MASFRRFPNGRWQAIVRRKGYRPQLDTFTSRSDAERWARQIENEIDRAVFIDRSPSERTTLGELIDRYIAEVLPSKKSGPSLKRCLVVLRPSFQAYTLVTLQPRDVVTYRDARLAAGRAGGTVVKELNTLSRVIDTAASEWGYYVPSNPVKVTKRPSGGRGRERRLTPDEEKALFAASHKSRSPMLPAFIRIALETGMRLGELLTLSWDDLDFTKRTARLHDTKNGDTRIVPLSMVALEAIGQLPRHISNPRLFWRWSRPDSFENA